MSTHNNNNNIEYQDNENYLPPIYEVQLDVEGYVTSFSVEQVTEYSEFFNKFGFVVIRDVLNKKESQDTINDVWEYIESFKWASHVGTMKEEEKTIKRNHPSTWNSWPNLSTEGIVGYPPIFSVTSLKNRSNPKIYDVYSNLLNRKDLYINHDRYGFFRPTKNTFSPFPDTTTDHHHLPVPVADDSETDTPIGNDNEKWKTVENLHLDLNPFSFIEDQSDQNRQKIFSTLTYKNGEDFFIENNQPGYMGLNELHIQGLVNLCDNKQEDGGFILVPGFNHHIKEWILNNEKIKKEYGYHSNFVCIKPDNPLYKRAIRVTARSGSLILFNQRLLHGSKPNNSNRPRICLFLKMFPSNQIPKDTLAKRTDSIKQCFLKHNNFPIEIDQFTPTQRKVLGLEFWEDCI